MKANEAPKKLYIDKAALVAEIERKRDDYINSFMTEQVHMLNNVFDIIDTLEVKEEYTWKPSDEQMEALKEACDEHWEPDGLDPLYTLYQNLKKL